MLHHSWPLLPSLFTHWGLGYQPGWQAHMVSPRWVGGSVQEMHMAVIPLSPPAHAYSVPGTHGHPMNTFILILLIFSNS